jgi:hypothetical protein
MLDLLDDDQLVQLYVIAGSRVAERIGNPYEPGTMNAKAFSAQFGTQRNQRVVAHLPELDTRNADSFSPGEWQAWLFRTRPIRGES